MKRIEFNPAGHNAIQLKFECKKCSNYIESEKIEIPIQDYIGDNTDENYEESNEGIICSKCSKRYYIKIWVSYTIGYVEIEGLAKNYNCSISEISIIPDEYYEQYYDVILSNTHFYSTFQTDIYNLRALNNFFVQKAMSTELSYTLRKHIYIGAITCMETYLSDAFVNVTLSKDDFLKSFVKTFKEFKHQKFELSELFSYQDKIKDIAKKAMLDVIYHDLPKVNGMYKDTLNIHLPDFGEFSKAVLIRHDLVHRNGRTKEGKKIELNDNIIIEVLAKVEHFIMSIDKQLRNIYTTPIPNQVKSNEISTPSMFINEDDLPF